MLSFQSSRAEEGNQKRRLPTRLGVIFFKKMSRLRLFADQLLSSERHYVVTVWSAGQRGLPATYEMKTVTADKTAADWIAQLPNHYHCPKCATRVHAFVEESYECPECKTPMTHVYKGGNYFIYRGGHQ